MRFVFAFGRCVGRRAALFCHRLHRPQATHWASTASASSNTGKVSPSSLYPRSSATTDLVFLLMSVSFGCLGVMSLRKPFVELASLLVGKSDLQSVFCLLVFCIVSLVLAYLTNPSENSFRTYLTEQSFRHHLSRLDDHLDSEQALYNGPSSRSFHSACFSRSAKAPADCNGPFHFANRASIALRTPKHVFHSFAIFTIAAMIPVQRGSSPSDAPDTWSISDSWYIGAFGKWWRGGVWETWYQDVIARSKDEEGWSSGILSMKNLDMLPNFNAGPYISKTLPYHLLKQSPPRLRNRDHLKSPLPRSSSPPPLSKSASLPLHAKRLPAVDRCDYLSPTAACLPMSSMAPVPTRSTLFDQSPLIVEVLRQISAATTSVQDLRAQYSEHQASSSQSRDLLNIELESCRERKRQEEASRLETKTRTKTLDDQKRAAEGLKREAERKLKAARTTRETTFHRIEFLDDQVATLRVQTQDDRHFLAQKSSDVPEVELELARALELKKTEIKLNEEALLGLNRRSRELEEKLAMERERLETLRQRTELRMQECSSAAYLASHLPDESSSYEQPPVYMLDSPSSPVHSDGVHAAVNRFGVYPEDFAESPSQYEVKGYPGIELDARRTQTYPDIGHSPTDHHIDFSRSLQLDNDPHFNQSWNNASLYSLSSNESVLTPASHFSNFDTQRDSDLRPPQVYDFSPVDGSSNGHYPWTRQEVNLMEEMGYLRDDSNQTQSASTSGRLRKGLNPSAKEFNLPIRKLSPPGAPSPTKYDALNPNGLVSMLPTPSPTNHSLLRAFAPSRAEREALQRALGGSTNSSFERLPSLSEVGGSIPSSPSHVHASTLKLDLSQTTKDSTGSSKTFNLPSWLTVLPNIRKSRFKPWDDDEPVSTTSGEDAVRQK